MKSDQKVIISKKPTKYLLVKSLVLTDHRIGGICLVLLTARLLKKLKVMKLLLSIGQKHIDAELCVDAQWEDNRNLLFLYRDVVEGDDRFGLSEFIEWRFTTQGAWYIQKPSAGLLTCTYQTHSLTIRCGNDEFFFSAFQTNHKAMFSANIKYRLLGM
jgi:hypothetical protein